MKDIRDTVIETLIEEKAKGKEIVVVVADSTSTSKIANFEKNYPKSVINVGIAEQNMVGVAVGISLTNKVVFTANAAPFLLARSLEQVKNDVCYSNTNVKMLGLNAGFGYGPLGATHHCVNDIAILRTFGNIEIFAPCDAKQTSEIVKYAIQSNKPTYIRLDSDKLSDISSSDYHFQKGEPCIIKKGKTTKNLIFTLGTITHEAINAIDQGLDATVVSLPSIYPLNQAVIVRLINEYQRIYTIEEHVLSGGLGTIIGEIILNNKLNTSLISLGIPTNYFTHSSSRECLRKEFNIDSKGIFEIVSQQ